MKAPLLGIGLAMIISAAWAEGRPQDAQWNVVATANLAASGEPAKDFAPPCVTGGEIIPAEIVRDKLYTAIDSYIGYPVIQVATSDPAVRNWLNERFGLNDGRSKCASLCGVVAQGTAVKICEADNKHGRACFWPPNVVGPGPQPWTLTENMTRASSPSGKADIVCIHVKHWAHDLPSKVTMETSP